MPRGHSLHNVHGEPARDRRSAEKWPNRYRMLTASFHKLVWLANDRPRFSARSMLVSHVAVSISAGSNQIEAVALTRN
jgi:hypothetical protein